jgi:hypothetical protein
MASWAQKIHQALSEAQSGRKKGGAAGVEDSPVAQLRQIGRGGLAAGYGSDDSDPDMVGRSPEEREVLAALGRVGKGKRKCPGPAQGKAGEKRKFQVFDEGSEPSEAEEAEEDNDEADTDSEQGGKRMRLEERDHKGGGAVVPMDEDQERKEREREAAAEWAREQQEKRDERERKQKVYEPLDAMKWISQMHTAWEASTDPQKTYCFGCDHALALVPMETVSVMRQTLDRLCGEIDASYLIRQIAFFYQTRIQPINENRPWCHYMIYQHLTMHNPVANSRLHQVQQIRAISSIQEMYERTMQVRNLKGELLPPNNAHVNTYLKVVREKNFWIGHASVSHAAGARAVLQTRMGGGK